MKIVTTIPKLPERAEDAHKGEFGRVLLVAGSVGMSGAACLAAESAQRAGAGLVTLALPKSLNIVAEVKLTCVMSRPLPETEDGSLSVEGMQTALDLSSQCDVVALGPGIGTNEESRELIRRLVRAVKKPMVVDADGLNALAVDTGLLKNCRCPVVLTPHPGEMARLAGLAGAIEVQENRMKVAGEFAREHHVIVILKGHETLVADGERTYVNPTGNPGMATGGAGDVLTGMVAGLLPQSRDPFEAAISAVFLHGLAGDIAAESFTQYCMTADDILDCLPEAFSCFIRKTADVEGGYVKATRFTC